MDSSPSTQPRKSARAPGSGWPPPTPSSSSTKSWIECRSQPFLGSVFSVYLPVAPDQNPAPQAEVADAVKGGSETILFVEDEEDVRQSLVDLLQAYGTRAS